MRRKAVFAVGKKKKNGGTAAALRTGRRPFQHMALARLRELKKIVPDAQDAADVDVLLRRTADYICALELKLTVLRRVSAIYGV
ncbi:hypothetical protein Zm00014a_037100 [Zea mays]|jgi:hypothetical protein|uniref:BHLH domain-containing protein n=2 Tax=Zea mays TaxID=4577 RepID=B6TLX1_MAIZE|nr:transcription factor UPBEAT1 [Zea mays]ACG38104.1 hypothetical protein [Zea mays]ONM55120.1 hypothetical protein ZEAMMB73_Zm00001d020558 [Zea mays]PWZ14580.1 hypothetical protein Zm00014a_037100 [Zea mays]|eukprot:XP_008652746.1 transcription factor UPBEAT1 [Zea mays]